MQLDWFTVAAQVVNFAVLVYLLKRFLYAPVTRAMALRQQRVTQQLREAEQREAAARAQADALAVERADLSQRRAAMLEAARTEAEAERARLFERVQAEAREREALLRAEIESDQARFAQRLRDESARWASGALARALADLADAPLESAVVRGFLHRIASLSDADASALAAEAGGSPLQVQTAFPLEASQRESIRQALRGRLGVETEFSVRPDPICGIELATDGLRVAWSVRGYLEGLEDRRGETLRGKDGDVRPPEARRSHVPTA